MGFDMALQCLGQSQQGCGLPRTGRRHQIQKKDLFNRTILSVPEGDEKPLKYPLMYEKCDLLVVNKVDDFDKYMPDVYEFYNLGIGDPHRRSPAVSINTYSFPLCVICVSTASLVVPAISDTIRRSSPNSRLIREDFPTFGFPTMATLGRSSSYSGCDCISGRCEGRAGGFRRQGSGYAAAFP